MRSSKILVVAVSLGLGSLLLGGCGSPGHGPGHAPRGARQQLPTLEAGALFFGGSLEATVRLAPRALLGGRGGRRGGGGGESRGPNFEGPGGGFGGPGGLSGVGGREGGGPGGGDSAMGGPRGFPEPGGGSEVAFGIHFKNTGSTKLVFMVWEFSSGLGSFAVRPEKIELEAGAEMDVQPMTSRLGGAEEGLQVALVLRNGQGEERQVLVLTKGDGPLAPEPRSSN